LVGFSNAVVLTTPSLAADSATSRRSWRWPRPHLVLRADDVEPFSHPAEPAYLSRHILGRESAGLHDLLLNQGTLRARSGLSGGNHPDNDEIYYAVRGMSWVDLGGDPTSGDGAMTYALVPGMIAFIPAGTFHRLRNDTDQDFVMLAIWPQPSIEGANGIHDERLREWGTGFRLRDGCDLISDGEGSRSFSRSRDGTQFPSH
jgi:mannose-6-phosphate isomerase-like protein (cupin superfamily)